MAMEQIRKERFSKYISDSAIVCIYVQTDSCRQRYQSKSGDI